MQLVVAAKPELFESGQLSDWFHDFARTLFCYSFPSGFGSATLGSLAKQIFIAHMRLEMGEDFFGGNAPITTDFFDRWWTIKHPDEISADELKACEVVPVSNLFEVLDRPDRENIFMTQSQDVQASLRNMLEVDDRPHGPNAGGTLYAEAEHFAPFPEPETVFAEDIETHLKYLLPVATVSLKHINPAWEGPIHFVQPVEPYEGVVGELTSEHHSQLCRKNWIGYRIDEYGRYTFASDWEYFLRKKLESRDARQAEVDANQLHEHYERARQSFETNRTHFQEYRGLHSSYSLEQHGVCRDRDRLKLVNQLGGKPGWGNWTEIGDWPLSKHKCDATEEPDETYPLPQAADGTDFVYIGWLHSFVYVDTSGCNLELFYHPELRLALTTFDWS